MSIPETIMKMRPKLKDNSIKSYTSILKSMYRQVYPKDKEIDISKFENTEDFLEYLKDYDPSVRKTYLSALTVFTENDIYRKKMMEDVVETAEMKSTHEPNQKQIDNKITQTEITALLHLLKNEAEQIYKTKNYTQENLLKLQNYVLICLFCGKWIPPRRSLDWCKFLIRPNDKSNDNFLDENSFVFNTYKTSSTYGEQRVEIPNALLKIVKKYISVIPSTQDYLFFTLSNKPLSSITLNQRFNSLFPTKKISVNQFRHLFLSRKYQKNVELDQDLKNMGTSKSMLTTYIQKGNYK